MGDTGLMAGGSLVQGGAGLANGISQYGAYRLQGQYGKKVGELNAEVASLQEQDATNRAGQESASLVRRTAAVAGVQRADMARQGVDVNTGSAAELQADTQGLSALDQLTIRNNAFRASFGFRMQGIQDTLEGQFSQIAGKTNANASALGGSMAFMRGGILANYYLNKNRGAGVGQPSAPDEPKEDPDNP